MRKIRLLILLLFVVSVSDAADMRMGNLCFNIIDTAKHEVEVTYQRLRSQENYYRVTDLRIPSAVMVDSTVYVVTRIGRWAFFPCADLQRVIIPPTVRSIGTAAFSSCVSLRQLELPDSLQSIEDGAFTNCKVLSKLTLPDSLQHLGESVFALCTRLTSIRIPEAVDTLGNSMFYSCTSLTTVYLPDHLQHIGAEAFSSCPNLKNLYLRSQTPPTLDPIAFGPRRRSGVTLWVPAEAQQDFRTVFSPVGIGVSALQE